MKPTELSSSKAWVVDEGVYQGTKKDKLRHGVVQIIQYGCIMERTYKDGKMHGFCRFISKDGSYRQGQYEDGKMIGEWLFVNPDGSIRENCTYTVAVTPSSKKDTQATLPTEPDEAKSKKSPTRDRLLPDQSMKSIYEK